jgi:predicted NBD/HSP70 family sugar kinase
VTLKERKMKHYAGLDVSLAKTAVCVVDENGVIVREAEVAPPPKTWRCGSRS